MNDSTPNYQVTQNMQNTQHTATHTRLDLDLPVIIFTNGARFELGNIVATPNALALLEETQWSAGLLVNRHVHGAFGDCCESDRLANEAAIEHGDRILSVYRLVRPEVLKATPEHQRSLLPTLWIITEADRSVTTLLCPQDY